MGMAAPQALVGGGGPGPPQKFGHIFLVETKTRSPENKVCY